ncbi:thiol reductant ABC exporter subunit CydD [Bacillus massiliigorillae]|uniref:thiol reductant ABC exporter subunit CydD n=1 Tax=Bacillus massiliigorillae TaxID=1243664 RepID=UPI0012B64600|nr:thiol reductant ABC exporter subunit CydD [Bacillus massiliigorillae]
MDKSLFQLKGFKGIMTFLTIMAILQGVMIIFQAKYLAITVTNLFNGEKLSLQLLPILLFVTFYLAKQIIILWREKQMHTYASHTGSMIRQKFTNKLFILGPTITEKEGTGHLVTMALEGVSQLETYLKLFLPKVMNMVIIPIMIFVYTLTLDVRSSIILLLVLPTLLIFMVILGIAAKKKADTQYESHQLLSNHFVDSLRGLETLRLLGLSKRYDRNIQKVSERYRKSTMGTLRFAFLSTFALDFFSSLSVAIVALFLGLGLIGEHMFLLPALTVLILAPEYFVPIREFGTDYHATLDGKNAFQAISDVINLPEKKQTNSTKLLCWNSESKIDVENLTFQHQDAHQPTLNNLSFSWKGYGKIGIIGASGSGKSTLINILGGFSEPNSSRIRINDIALNDFSETSWQEQLLYIPQHPYIFHNTVANNISFYTPDASKADIEKASERAGLSDVIATLPNGYEEQIGESGRILSGGQEQRIALARAFLDDKRKILLFDEPTAHLDIETEWELKSNMLPLLENRLVFFATHRLHWMMEMDQIIVLDHGEIVEIGTHEELVASKGHYHNLIQAQMHGTGERHEQ